MICKECGKQLKRITPTHLRGPNCKGLIRTVAEYQEKYPGEPILDEEVRRKTAVTLHNFIKKYGYEEGEYRWKLYRQKQAETNTFEYKKAVHGWDEERFKEYNKSRATTLDNLIRRHGDIKGNEIWKRYIDRQRYTNTLEYFIEREGSPEKAIELLREYNEMKGKAYDPQYIAQKYKISVDEAISIITGRSSEKYVSKAEIDFVDHLISIVGEIKYTYKTRQFGIWSQDANRIFFYDVVCSTRNKIIEFHGDYWHANPSRYHADYVIAQNGLRAHEVWKRDELKSRAARERGFSLYTVWQSEYHEDPDGVISRVAEWWNEDL